MLQGIIRFISICCPSYCVFLKIIFYDTTTYFIKWLHQHFFEFVPAGEAALRCYNHFCVQKVNTKAIVLFDFTAIKLCQKWHWNWPSSLWLSFWNRRINRKCSHTLHFVYSSFNLVLNKMFDVNKNVTENDCQYEYSTRLINSTLMK